MLVRSTGMRTTSDTPSRGLGLSDARGPDSVPSPPGPTSDRFERLYRECRDDLFAYLAYLLSDRTLAEEVTATAFERAFRKRARFNPRRGDLRGWLFRIARNAAIDELRRRNREAALGFDAVDLERRPGDGAVESTNVDRVWVAVAMQRLEPRERELVALKFFGGLANTEIAKVLAISETNVGTQLHRALSKLRTVLDD